VTAEWAEGTAIWTPLCVSGEWREARARAGGGAEPRWRERISLTRTEMVGRLVRGWGVATRAKPRWRERISPMRPGWGGGVCKEMGSGGDRGAVSTCAMGMTEPNREWEWKNVNGREWQNRELGSLPLANLICSRYIYIYIWWMDNLVQVHLIIQLIICISFSLLIIFIPNHELVFLENRRGSPY
jgi:hypothetical protein